jgi:hypothetical protein
VCELRRDDIGEWELTWSGLGFSQLVLTRERQQELLYLLAMVENGEAGCEEPLFQLWELMIVENMTLTNT